MTIYQQQPPYTVQIELTEGCNLRCPFCGLNGIRGKQRQFKFLSIETAATNKMLDWALQGDPYTPPVLREWEQPE